MSREQVSGGSIPGKEKSMREVSNVLGTSSLVWLESRICEWE